MTDLAPNLKKILLKICQRHERRGTLSGVMKLGQYLPDEELRPLENFFGLYPLIRTARGELKLSFDRLLRDKSSADINTWLNGIYHLLDRHIPVAALPKKDDFHLLLEQLRLAFPRLEAVHHFLQDNKGSFRRKFKSSGNEFQEFFFTAARIVDFLLDNAEAITLSDLGARFCGNSKILRQGKLNNIVEQWLAIMRPDLPEELGIWQEFMVIRDRMTVTALIFAPLIYQKDGREYDWVNQLYQAGEPALLNWLHLEGISSIRLASEDDNQKNLITCENEAPFSILLRENSGNIILFTAGFPNRAVLKLYQLLTPLCCCRHWGDSDLAGLRIAAILHAISPLELWRCDLATLQKHRNKLLPLEKGQADIAATVLEQTPAFPFHKELAFSIQHGWLEQESWQADPPGHAQQQTSCVLIK